MLDGIARFAIKGIGDARLGEWEQPGSIYHLRRRLSQREALQVGGVCDIRGTPEAIRRIAAVDRWQIPELRGVQI